MARLSGKEKRLAVEVDEEPLTQEEIDEIITPCLYSTPEMAVTFFPSYVSRPFCGVHDVIFDLVDDDMKRLVALAAPRGFGKTTCIGLFFIARKVLFRFAPYIVYISSSAKEAALKIKTLATELIYNPLIKKLFGDLKGVKWAEEAGEIELVDADGIPFCFIQAKGSGSQVRGLNWRGRRPTIFIVDDLEDKDEMQNETIRAKQKAWFFSDLVGAMDNADLSESRLIVIGTVVHQDSLLANLLSEKTTMLTEGLGLSEDEQAILEAREKFYSIRLEACNDKYESLWPEYMSTARIRAKAAAYRFRGQLDLFFMEFRNLVIATEDSPFQSGFFKYYTENEDQFKDLIRSCENVVIVDPAKTSNPKSADTAILGVGFSSKYNKILLRDSLNAKLHPDEIFKEACDMCDRIGAFVIGFETTGLSEFATYPLQQYINTRKKYYQLVEIKANKEKLGRIRGLIPFYRMGVILHNSIPEIHGPLEGQLLSFPYSQLLDVMDCFANIIKMFNLGERNFSQVPLLENEGEEYEDIEAEYKVLEDEDREEGKFNYGRIV
jgi:hypothetical protein